MFIEIHFVPQKKTQKAFLTQNFARKWRDKKLSLFNQNYKFIWNSNRLQPNNYSEFISLDQF